MTSSLRAVTSICIMVAVFDFCNMTSSLLPDSISVKNTEVI